MRYFYRAIFLAAALTLYFSPVARSAQAVTSNVQVPLSGTVFVPLSDGPSDMVKLPGMVHVFAYFQTRNPLQPGDPMRIQINLDRVTGVGDEIGRAHV